MENTKTKYTILGLVFLLSVGFFWLAINQYLLPSKAQQGSNLQIIPASTAIECNPAGECILDILGSTDTTNKVAGVTGMIEYSEGLEPVRLDQSPTCAQSSLGLTERLQFSTNTITKTVTFSVGSLEADTQLKGGNGCIASVVFKPVNITVDPTIAKMALTQAQNWKAGGLVAGVKAAFQVGLDSSSVSVKISKTVPLPTPIVTTIPLPSGTPSACVAKGDCNCDGTTDLVDLEMVRSYVQKEGASCDVNADGKGDYMDIFTWAENNSLIKPFWK